MRIISLTSIPPRFDQIAPTLVSLTRQRSPADKIILYIPKTYRRFPDHNGHLPRVPDGVEIRQPDTDCGPARKVLHTVRDFADQNVDILFCDDERLNQSDWSSVFFDARKDHPDDAVAPISWDAGFLYESAQKDRPQPRALRRDRTTDVPFQIEMLIWKLHRALGALIEGPSHKFFKMPAYRDIFQG